VEEEWARRALWVGVLVFFALLVIVAELWNLDMAQGSYYRRLAQQDFEQQLPTPPPRGNIVTADGVVIADDRPAWELEWFSHGTTFMMPEREVRAVAALLGTNPVQLAARIKRTVAQQPAYWPVVLDPNRPLTVQQITRYEENRMALPGLHLLAVPERYYPYGSVGGNLIGYLADINAQELASHPNQGYLPTSLWGQAGIEAEFQQYLHGRPGYQLVEVNPAGDVVKVIGQTPPVPGDTVHLTIDWHLEEVASEALAYVIKAMHDSPDRYAGSPYSPTADRGAVIVMNPENGDILALVSYPSYNPNRLPQDYMQVLAHNELLNATYQGWYAPGSIFKPMMATAALASHVVTPNTVIYDPGYFSLDPSFKNWNPSGFGAVNITKAIEVSDDTYFYWVGYWMGIRRMDHYIKLYGLDGTTGLDLPGEWPSQMPTPAQLERLEHVPWTWGWNLNTVIGQGTSEYTLIGLARAESAVANGGTLWWPHVAASITRGRKVVKVFKPRVQWRTGIPAWVYRVVHQGMEMSAQDPLGTGYGAMAGIPMPVATKTGTAQKANGAVDDAFFTTFAPANWVNNPGPLPTPKLDIVVWIQNGVFGAYSGFVARAIYDQYFHLNDPSAGTLFDSVYGLNWTWPFSWTGHA
jgi:penicillin-binding protein 2